MLCNVRLALRLTLYTLSIDNEAMERLPVRCECVMWSQNACSNWRRYTAALQLPIIWWHRPAFWLCSSCQQNVIFADNITHCNGENAFSMRFTLSPVCPSVCHACSMKEPGILHSCTAGIHCNVSICARIGGHINYTDFGLPKFSNIISAKKTQNTRASEYFRLAL